MTVKGKRFELPKYGSYKKGVFALRASDLSLVFSSNNCVFFSLKWKYSSKEFVKHINH